MSIPRPRYLKAAAGAALVLSAIAATGCGSDNPNNPSGEPGKRLFVEKCGSCHVLAAADTKGVTGPNLDAAFKQSLNDGLKRSTIESVTYKQILIPMGDVMPAKLLEGDDAKAVAAYVADSIGKEAVKPEAGAKTEPQSGEADAKNAVDNPADPTGQLAYQFTSLQAKPGKVTLSSTNDSSVPHNIALKDGPEGEVISGGKTSKVTASLKAGKYTFYCSVPGHEQAGMKGTLDVK